MYLKLGGKGYKKRLPEREDELEKHQGNLGGENSKECESRAKSVHRNHKERTERGAGAGGRARQRVWQPLGPG